MHFGKDLTIIFIGASILKQRKWKVYHFNKKPSIRVSLSPLGQNGNLRDENRNYASFVESGPLFLQSEQSRERLQDEWILFSLSENTPSSEAE